MRSFLDMHIGDPSNDGRSNKRHQTTNDDDHPSGGSRIGQLHNIVQHGHVHRCEYQDHA